MDVDKRRVEILKILKENKKPVPGNLLAKKFSVSRQVIVKDIGIIRALGEEIISTNRGYLLKNEGEFERIVKVKHSKERIGEELNLLVDMGVSIKDVFIIHKAYGKIKRDLSIKSRHGVSIFLESIKKDSPLLKLTSGIHYHTLLASDEEILSRAENLLDKKGFIEK